MSQNQPSIGAGKILTWAIVILAFIIIGWNIYTGSTVQEIGIPGFFTIKFGPKPTATPTQIPPTPVQPTLTPTLPPPTSVPPTSEPTSAATFVLQPSYSEDCRLRPQGSVCISFSDGYIWLVYDSIIGWSNDESKLGKKVEAALGSHSDYHHILGTSFVKEVPHE